MKINYKGWRDLQRVIWSFINWWRDIIRSGEIWTGLIRVFILVERYGGSYLEILYLRRDLEMPVPSNYISGRI